MPNNVQGNHELQFLKEEVIVNQFLHNYHLPQTHPEASKEIWCGLFFYKRKAHITELQSALANCLHSDSFCGAGPVY